MDEVHLDSEQPEHERACREVTLLLALAFGLAIHFGIWVFRDLVLYPEVHDTETPGRTD